VVVPVKSFRTAKQRLAPALTPLERAELARHMATAVLRAARPLLVWVACDDPEVADWARSEGARIIWTAGLGLNGAVSYATNYVFSLGAERLTVVHGDLPLATGFLWVQRQRGIVLVPDRKGGGTNLVSLPKGASFQFSYGPGSFRRHYISAWLSGLDIYIWRPKELCFDVDLPEDLAYLRLLSTNT
jgi:2-phospho-L-lactate guanylyltransferase